MKKNDKPLPEIGSTYAFPLADGRFSACRIIAYKKEGKDNSLKVVCTKWIDNYVPALHETLLRSILFANHHSWNNSPVMCWVSDPIPKEFIPLGMITPTKEELQLECNSYGGWAAITFQPLAQWLWDNQSKQADAQTRTEEEENQILQSEIRSKREECFRNMTLEKLLKRKFFPAWTVSPGQEVTQASRDIMIDTAQNLIDIGLDADQALKISVLRNCILDFNALDKKFNFIGTVEREDICEEFEHMIAACNLEHLTDLPDEWRDW